jgi:uroporphyrinogen-III decarboxylase
MIRFDPERYAARIEESKQRWATAQRFEEPDRVPIAISTAGSYYCRLFGYNIRDCYTSMEVAIDVQLRGLKWAFEELADDRTDVSLGWDLGPVGEAIVFNCPIEYPDDTSPRIVPIIETVEDIQRLQVPDVERHPGIHNLLQLGEVFKAKAKRVAPDLPAHAGRTGIHPPLSCACALMESSRFYELLYADPDHADMLMQKCFETFCRLRDYYNKIDGITQQTRLGLADDNSAFISNQMYRERVFKYNKALYDRYGSEWRYLHADGPNDHHFQMYADEMKLSSMDMGGWSSREAAKKYLGGKTFFTGGLNCKDLYYDFATAKVAIDEALRICAPGGGFGLAIGGETYPGVRPDTLVHAVRYAKTAGRYPIQR